jgi:hypothetical protein
VTLVLMTGQENELSGSNLSRTIAAKLHAVHQKAMAMKRLASKSES